MEDSQQNRETSLGWAAAFAVVGMFYIADYFYQGRASLAPLMTGLGFLAVSPHAFLRPVRLTRSLSSQSKRRVPVPLQISWLAVAGAVLLLAGAAVRWL